MRVQPTFENLHDTEAINRHIKQLTDTESEANNPFPVHVFPDQVQEIIRATNQCLKFPIDFTGVSILFAVSVATGNTHRLKVPAGWVESAIFYIAIVSRPGTNKSHPLSWILTPFANRDNQSFLEYKAKKKEYDAAQAMNKKEREQSGLADLPKPFWKQFLVSDFTPEALADVHYYNLRGIGVHSDELASWFKNFNRYNKGSEEQFWLSAWSAQAIRINRKTSDPILIQKPFISVCGTIQNGVLTELVANRTENGFIDRMLFAIPEDLKKEQWSNTPLPKNIAEQWEAILSRLLDFQLSASDLTGQYLLSFTQEAWNILLQWQSENVALVNMTEDDNLRGIYSKMDNHVLRLCLCLEMLRYACNQSDKSTVGIEAVTGAIELVEYFKRSAVLVHEVVANSTPLDRLPGNKKALFEKLPPHFTTAEGWQIAVDAGFKKRNFMAFLENRNLFERTKHGAYSKKL